MKTLFIAIAVLFTTANTQTLQAQDAADSSRLSQVLQSYFNIKDALVEGNNKTASESATAFTKNLNGISIKLISEGNVNTLLKDAGTIADAKSIDKQRVAFANFSTNMTDVTKALKLSGQPVYVQYCPMKKASWLSNEKSIKNPYYGSSMLTCGKVTDTIQQ
ncbi:MAG: DUF3347 domain-containing protein [Ginsengibacter sp.]